MGDTRTHNSMRNIVFGLLNRMVSIFFPFIVRTIFIKFLGESYLGLSSLFSSILQVLNLADLGFASAIVASMKLCINLFQTAMFPKSQRC